MNERLHFPTYLLDADVEEEEEEEEKEEEEVAVLAPDSVTHVQIKTHSAKKKKTERV